MLDVLNADPIPIVHVGSRYSAEQRAAHMGTYDNLFKLRISPEATIDPEIWEDQEDSWEVAMVDYEYDVTRYVNMWESPGSISLLVKPTVIDLVSQTHVW